MGGWKMKEEIQYYKYDSLGCEFYAFYLWNSYAFNWVWEEDKLTEKEALDKYPKDKYEWVEIKE